MAQAQKRTARPWHARTDKAYQHLTTEIGERTKQETAANDAAADQFGAELMAACAPDLCLGLLRRRIRRDLFDNIPAQLGDLEAVLTSAEGWRIDDLKTYHQAIVDVAATGPGRRPNGAAADDRLAARLLAAITPETRALLVRELIDDDIASARRIARERRQGGGVINSRFSMQPFEP